MTKTPKPRATYETAKLRTINHLRRELEGYPQLIPSIQKSEEIYVLLHNKTRVVRLALLSA
jgi:hypothetical protein